VRGDVAGCSFVAPADHRLTAAFCVYTMAIHASTDNRRVRRSDPILHVPNDSYRMNIEPETRRKHGLENGDIAQIVYIDTRQRKRIRCRAGCAKICSASAAAIAGRDGPACLL
jgi:hypothetical protein